MRRSCDIPAACACGSFHFLVKMSSKEEREYFRNVRDRVEMHNGMYSLLGNSNFTEE